MEILQEKALGNERSDPFSDNLDAKTKAIQQLVEEKLQDCNKEFEKNDEHHIQSKKYDGTNDA